MALRWAAHRARRAGRPPDRTGYVVRARSSRPSLGGARRDTGGGPPSVAPPGRRRSRPAPSSRRPLRVRGPLRPWPDVRTPHHRPGDPARNGGPPAARNGGPTVPAPAAGSRPRPSVAGRPHPAPPARWPCSGRLNLPPPVAGTAAGTAAWKGGNRPAGRWCARRGRVGRAARSHRSCTSAGSGTPCRGARVATGPAVPRARPARRCSPWCPPLRPQAARAQDGEPGRNGRTLRQARPSGPTHAKGPAPIIGAGPSGVLRNSCPRQRAGVLWGCWGAIPRAVVYLARASLPIAG